MGLMERLAYRLDPIDEQIREAASDAACECGYDQFEEQLLGHEILDIRWVSSEALKALFPEFLAPPCSFDPNGIVRVDWQTWAVPTSFNGQYEEAVVERVCGVHRRRRFDLA